MLGRGTPEGAATGHREYSRTVGLLLADVENNRYSGVLERQGACVSDELPAASENDSSHQQHTGVVLGMGETAEGNHHHRGRSDGTNGVLRQETVRNKDYFHQLGS